MKNSRFTILLLAAVLTIWSIISYKVYKAINGSDKKEHLVKSPDFQNHIDVADTYMLHTYARDPFLSILNDTQSVLIPEQKSIVKPLEKKAIVLPQYCGLISNTKVITGIFRIDKKVFFVHQGEELKGIKIKMISQDSVIGIVDNNRVYMRVDKKRKK